MGVQAIHPAIHQNGFATQDAGTPAVNGEPIVLRLDHVKATPRNVARIRSRVKKLNSELDASGLPFRVRLVKPER